MFRKIGVFMLAMFLFSGCANAAGYDGRADDGDLKAYIEELCAEYGIPETLVFAVIEKESSWNADAVNYNETCFGLMQINVINFAWLEEDLGLDDPKDPYQNVKAGIYMLSGYLEKYIDYHMALMCYNCGETGARQLWQEGSFTNAYSRWVINRMNDLEWEALDAARERLALQAMEGGEESLPEANASDDDDGEWEDSWDFTYAEPFPDAADVLTDMPQKADAEEADRSLVFYAEDTVAKNVWHTSVRPHFPHARYCRAALVRPDGAVYRGGAPVSTGVYYCAGLAACGFRAGNRWCPLYCTEYGHLIVL